ncbi:hypothetical protein ONZ45_g13805 [Pleurotus djamor]|nr:hypothetical protein ONZ45_g13805 [Pleurotus djamor]
MKRRRFLDIRPLLPCKWDQEVEASRQHGRRSSPQECQNAVSHAVTPASSAHTHCHEARSSSVLADPVPIHVPNPPPSHSPPVSLPEDSNPIVTTNVPAINVPRTGSYNHQYECPSETPSPPTRPKSLRLKPEWPLKLGTDDRLRFMGFDAFHLPHTPDGWLGRRFKEISTRYAPPGDFTLLPWDPSPGGSIRLVDRERRVFAAMATGPHDYLGPEWDGIIAGCTEAIQTIAPKCTFKPTDKDHRRGLFRTLAAGITLGPGSTTATCRSGYDLATKNALNELLENDALRHIAGYQSHLLRLFSPNLADFYRDTLDSVIGHLPHLKRTFEDSDFAAITINCGPHTVCKKHVDSANLAWGWCAITALGNYDHRRGGHLVLWDLRLVIEFPPGCTILIPSAVLHHSNTPIHTSETRYSVTQYTSGELFRWVHNGFKMKKDATPSPPAEVAKLWKEAIGMYSTTV